MIEIQIINMLSLFWKHTTFLAVYCTLFIQGIFKNKQKQKTAKQTSKTNKQTKQNKKEKKKKGRGEKAGPQQNMNPVPSGCHYAIEDEHLIC